MDCVLCGGRDEAPMILVEGGPAGVLEQWGYPTATWLVGRAAHKRCLWEHGTRSAGQTDRFGGGRGEGAGSNGPRR